MQNLFAYSHDNPDLTPSAALQQLVAEMNARSAATFNANLNASTSGQQTPNFANGAQYASPASGAHLNLPMTMASPATMHMSPAMHAHGLHQSAIGMIPQQSQPGTNHSGTGSQGTSANASPNVTTKRRRPSGIKSELDDVASEVNGNGGKVKASPRVPKRQKGQAG